jgi:hypothetical protein
MQGLLFTAWGNPSSDHVYGQQARVAADKARAEVAALLSCTPQEVRSAVALRRDDCTAPLTTHCVVVDRSCSSPAAQSRSTT